MTTLAFLLVLAIKILYSVQTVTGKHLKLRKHLQVRKSSTCGIGKGGWSPPMPEILAVQRKKALKPLFSLQITTLALNSHTMC